MPARCAAPSVLIRKEARQIVRDPSSIAIGIVLPVVLILLFGYGLSLDVTEVPVAVVLEDTSPAATDLAASFQLSHYFAVQLMTSMARAEKLMLARKVDGIIRIRPDFGRRLVLAMRKCRCWCMASMPITRASFRAMRKERWANGWPAARRRDTPSASGPVVVQSRMWFNEANESRYFLVPGLIVLIMTLIGALLTALVMAREWERGTFEALFVTPVRTDEILLGKTIPYFVSGRDRLGVVSAGGQVSLSCAVSRFGRDADGVFDALLARGARHRSVDFVGGQKSIRRKPNHRTGDLSAGGDAVGFCSILGVCRYWCG